MNDAKSSSEVKTRVLTAAVVVPVLLGFIFYGCLPFTVLVCVFMATGLLEFYRMADKKGARPRRIIGTMAPVGATFALGIHRPIAAFAIAAVGVLAVLVAELTRDNPEGAIPNISTTVMGMTYVGFLLAHAILLREYLESDRMGILFLILALAGSMVSDAFAYFTGRAYGKRKLIPNISPGKTVEGSIGGLAGGVFGVCLFKGIADLLFFDASPISWGEAALLGLVLAVAGMAGDLVESMLKRDAGVKDSGNVFPGHGGMLDRLDSLLFTIPATLYFVMFIAG